MNFNSENRFFSFMSLVGDLIFLNVLFLFTSLPILTFGASCCALYVAVRKRLQGKESYIIKDYMNAWKANLKGAVCIWTFLLIALCGMVFFTMYIASHLDHLPEVILYSFLFMWLTFTLLYAFPLQATFVNTPVNILKNSILTAIGHLPRTMLMFFTTYIPLILTLAFPNAIGITAVYWAVIGCSVSMVCLVPVMQKVLAFYIPSGK